MIATDGEEINKLSTYLQTELPRVWSGSLQTVDCVKNYLEKRQDSTNKCKHMLPDHVNINFAVETVPTPLVRPSSQPLNQA